MAQLEVLSGPMQSKVVAVSGPRFLVGRRRGCHLVLEDGWVSREHAVIIEVTPGVFRLQDLSSENGLFLNGDRVTEAALRHDDQIRIGRTEIRFNLRDDADGEESADQPMRTDLEPVGQSPTDMWVPNTAEGGEQDMTALDPEQPRDQRVDHRDRIRRLERQLEQREDENRRLAMENAVYKRALAEHGMLDRDTGQIIAVRVGGTANSSMAAPFSGGFLSNLGIGGASGDSGPEDGRFAVGLVGMGEFGVHLVSQLHSRGYHRALLLGTAGEAMSRSGVPEQLRVEIPPSETTPTLQGILSRLASEAEGLSFACHEGLGQDRSLHLLVAGLGGVTGIGAVPLMADLLQDYGELLATSRKRMPATGLLLMTHSELEQGQEAGLAEEGWKDVRRLVEAGKLSPLWILGNEALGKLGRNDPEITQQEQRSFVACGVMDALHRGLEIAMLSGQLRAEEARQAMLSQGVGSFGVGMAAEGTEEGLQDALKQAFAEGWLGTGLKPSRGHEVITLVGIGSGVLTDEPDWLGRVEPLVKEAMGQIPQAKTQVAQLVYRGEGVRVLVFVGGLPLPDSITGGPDLPE